MKRKILTCILFLTIVTGCKKNELICEKKEKNAGYDYSEVYELIYGDDKENLKQIKLTMESKYNSFYTEEKIAEEYDDVVEYCDFYESGSNKLIECKPTLNDNIINIKIKIKVDKINDELFEKMMYVTKDEINNKKETKKLLKNVGYTCKS